MQRSGKGFVKKKKRQELLAKLMRDKPTGNQLELLEGLRAMGVETTQASISRDLAELGVVKVDGIYKLPTLEKGQSAVVDRLTSELAGDNLIVLRTGPGHAPVAAVHIDKAKIQEIIGTIAGDDTIFIAVADRAAQTQVVKKVFALFGSR